MQKYFLSLVFFIFFQNIIVAQSQISVIPQPNKIVVSKGYVDYSTYNDISIHDEALRPMANLYQQSLAMYKCKNEIKYVKRRGKFKQQKGILLCIDKKMESEKYVIENTVFEQVQICGGSEKALFYALQTLIQLFPTEKSDKILLACARIEDKPRFAYRGAHLDVCRHFFPIEFIKKYIDVLAMHKLNTFHWHLTDDQGWRIEIKKYPKLTEIGGFRKETLVGHASDSPEVFDGQRYGGFYTQDQIREIVAYAATKYITVIPEIEMPGHAMAALSAYPELACTSGPFEAATKWGVFDDVFCAKASTITFLENVLAEVMPLFPSQYIHIGGDECPKVRWKKCLNCQAIMSREGLKNEEELQSYFIRSIEKYVNKNGKRIIGWDEILEGGVAPDATIMSWRGTEGGIAAARQGHDAIMTPGSFCYFDHYQSDNKDEPLAIGGLTTVENIYAYDPVPKELTSEQAKHILGTQCNVWTEYIGSTSQVEYMLLPRLSALSEVMWTNMENRNFDNFKARLPKMMDNLSKLDYNVSYRFYDIKGKTETDKDGNLKVTLSSNDKKANLTYQVFPAKLFDIEQSISEYSAPFTVSEPNMIRAWNGNKDSKSNLIWEVTYAKNLATGKPITLTDQASESYPGENAGATLVDGLSGTTKFNGRQWLGFEGKNLEAVIDFGKAQPFKKIKVGILDDVNDWIHIPKSLVVYGSKDGIDYLPIAKSEKGDFIEKNRYIEMPLDIKQFRYLKVILQNHGTIETGLPGADNPSWLFVDEIVVE